MSFMYRSTRTSTEPRCVDSPIGNDFFYLYHVFVYLFIVLGLLFRLSPNVWGMSEKCNECGFHFDHLSNSMYKHNYDKACEKNIIRKVRFQIRLPIGPDFSLVQTSHWSRQMKLARTDLIGQ